MAFVCRISWSLVEGGIDAPAAAVLSLAARKALFTLGIVRGKISVFFFEARLSHKIKEMIDAGDIDQLTKDRVPLKLLRVTNKAREGFILTDFPRCVVEAEMLEEYRGGMNAFVHLSVPDDVQVQIEETKANCGDCGRTYYPQIIENVDQGIRIDHLLLSPQAADRLVSAGIDTAPRGKPKASDHTPVWCELKDAAA